MNSKMQTSVALLAVSLLCLSVAEAQHPGKQGGEGGNRMIPHKVQGYQKHNAQVFKILREVEAKLRNNERQLEDLRREMKDNRVAFGATIGNVGNFGPFNTEVILKYGKVFSNTGAFNPGTGIFTAPVRGFYYFSFSGHNFSIKPMGLKLMKNEEHVVSVYNHPFGLRHETATNGMTLQLEVGDHVYMRLFAHTWVFDNVNSHSTFIGHLLFRL